MSKPLRAIAIYDSMQQQVLPLEPIEPGHIRLYACGVTVYDRCHIGHARGMIVFDAWVQFLRMQGYRVTYVRNITDIDDKIVARAEKNKCDWQALTREMIANMHADLSALGLSAPNEEPKATDYMADMIDYIQRLIDGGHAYATDQGDVYFSVHDFSDYGKLSHRCLDDLISGARVNPDPSKKNPLDFALWKRVPDDEPHWPSPWGNGRPGWHLECSVMSTALLGQPFDVHGGGMDLKFPHHENEIAQSESLQKKDFAHYWMHIGLVQINQEKMSKSLNNFITIDDALSESPAEVLRFLMLSSHYRRPVNYSPTQLQQSMQALRRLYQACADLPTVPVDENAAWCQAFFDRLADDFNTPQAFALAFDRAREINAAKAEGNVTQAAIWGSELRYVMSGINLLTQDPSAFLNQGQESVDHTWIDACIQERHAARDAKNWTRADEIRHELLEKGIELLDADGRTTWRIKQ